jgi:hypothetical protein
VNGRIGLFDLAGKPVLGFDTGLDSQAFAQAKLASFISQTGLIVRPGGETETWIPGGVLERGGTMVIWGPAFAGERLDLLLAGPGREDEALDALRRWIAAWPAAAGSGGGEDGFPAPWPAAALAAGSGDGGAYPPGTVFFPPPRLVKRCVEAEGEEVWRHGAERWAHPDLRGPEAAAFSAGAMLYRVLTGAPPFPREDGDLLREDIREGVFVPPRLAAPGLEAEAAALIAGAIAPLPGKGAAPGPRPGLDKLGALLGPAASRGAASWARPLGAGEAAVLERERERFNKRKTLTVNTRRFVIRNTAIITGAFAVLLIAGMITQSIVKSRAELPTTRGMSPREVVSAYYGAFGELDHQLMEACVTGKAGKEDISMVTNLFVISRMRMAYELNAGGIVPAQKWLDTGAPAVSGTVFGVSDLKIEPGPGGSGGEELSFRARYRLWVPPSFLENTEEIMEAAAVPDAEPPPSVPLRYTDEIRLSLHKGAWRITGISRGAGEPGTP